MMSIAAGQLNSTLTLPTLDLPFTVILSRATEQSGGLQPKKVWAQRSAQVRCYASPLRDELLFMQAGQQNASTVVFYFYANEDIKVHDRVKFLNMPAVVGAPDAWFELQQRFAASDNLRYIRCLGMVTDIPR